MPKLSQSAMMRLSQCEQLRAAGFSMTSAAYLGALVYLQALGKAHKYLRALGKAVYNG